MRVLWVLLFFCCLIPTGAAEEAEPTADWTQNEQLMHEALKEAQPDASEAEIQETMGYVFLNKNNQWEKAANHYKQAVQLNPKLFRSWYSLGLIFMEEGDGYLRKAVEANPNFAPAWYWLGYNACRAGNDSGAVTSFEKFLQVANGQEEAGRIKVATAVLAELRAERPGEEVQKICAQG